MGDNVRAEISHKNRYYISKHRYYELKHFCLQYDEWKELYFSVQFLNGQRIDGMPHGYAVSDPTFTRAELRNRCLSRMKMVEQACLDADSTIYNYILQAVTKEYSFNYLKYTLNMPCEKDYFYDKRRKFFWILSQTRK